MSTRTHEEETLTKQEKAGQRALAQHRQERGTRDGQTHCACGWATQTMGATPQQKSFSRHVIKKILEAAKQAEATAETPAVAQLDVIDSCSCGSEVLYAYPGAPGDYIGITRVSIDPECPTHRLEAS